MITINGIELEESSVFPGGEVHIKLPDINYLKETIQFRQKNVSHALPSIMVEATIRSSNELMQLILVKDALKEEFLNISTGLQLMYLPYARQDRVCNTGEAFSARVFASMLDAMEFNVIITADVHSNVILSHITTPVIQLTVNDIFKLKYQPLMPDMVLVAPDKGSYDKVKGLAEMLGVPFISASKVRKDGNISIELNGTTVTIEGKNLLIVDDICDGGGTFISLSKLLKYKAPKTINLYVTHGIFSKGLRPLREAGIDRIYTTNSIAREATGWDSSFFIWEI
jgi:ribose-phosphate pyrophosphokinase